MRGSQESKARLYPGLQPEKRSTSVEFLVKSSSKLLYVSIFLNFNQCFNFEFTFFIVNVENSRKGVEVQMSYVGCLRNVRLNHVPVSFEEMTSVFGPINTNECPVE